MDNEKDQRDDNRMDPQSEADRDNWEKKNERGAGDRNNDSSSDRNTGGRERGRGRD